ncbi:MAG: AAA family ATPase [Bacteroidales bacterium]|nr:AAA family ATPase [Bacteroidales bacterium]
MLVLPKEKSVPKINNPKFLILAGRPKSGKSTLMSALDNNLIIDLENGYQALSALVVQARSINDFAEIANALKTEINNNEGKFPYKYITIDNATRLEEMCLSYAAQLYRQTPMGKNYQGTDIRTLPNGSGYMYLRQAVRKVIDMFRGLCESLILITHTKDRMINFEGTEVNEIAIDLAGKLGDILCGEADAIGYVYRKKNETIISFEGGEGTVREARATHLRGKKIVVAESDDNNNITFYMDRIFLEQ